MHNRIMKTATVFLLLIASGVTAGFGQTISEPDTLATLLKRHSLKVRLDVGPQFHLKDRSNNDPNIPDQFEDTTGDPSISLFFGHGLDIKGSLSYYLPINMKPQLFVGIEYARSTITNNEMGSEVVLGEKLKISSITPFIGLGNFFDSENSTFVYGFAGVPLRNYEGSYTGAGDFDGFDFAHSYDAGTFFRLGGGVELMRVGGSGVEFGLGGHIDIGSVTRGDIEVSQNGMFVETAEPTGVRKLADPQLEIYVSLGYRLQL
ncbi:MAG: hypothetical protein ACRBF0_14700 [Calditrichia bacterium]